jgi:hypothetical protein
VLAYLGRYTHKVAISNNRILRVVDGKVTFTWRDYKEGNKNKEMTIDSQEFIRRFILHILPSGFVKIRHYGLLSHRNKAKKLKSCKAILGAPIANTEEPKKKESDSELLFRLTGKDPSVCSVCKKGQMRLRQTILPQRASPPLWKHAS